MADILNLDSLKVTRAVVMHGKERTLRSMTVEQFIEVEDFESRLKEANPREQVKLLVDRLADFMDDTTVEELKLLTLEQLMALMAFASGRDVTDRVKQQAAGDASTEGNAEKPRS